MTVVFDIDKLKSVLSDFHCITGVTVSVFDADFNQLIYYPKPMQSFCAAIKATKEGNRNCFESDMKACKKCAVTGRPHTFMCHAGLVDTAVPVKADGKIIAYIMFGQIRDSEGLLSDFETAKKLCSKYKIPEKLFYEYYHATPMLTKSSILACADIFKMCTAYLHENRMIKVQKNELANSIDVYINENLDSPLSVDDICRHFSISKNHLYLISHQFFNTSIREYIICKRLDKAKNLLTTTDLPVSEISAKSGFGDYNYFIRIFKNRIGKTPLEYRKKFPLDII